MYLASHTRPNICFAVNLLSRFSSCPTQRHWNGIKHILRYLQGTKDLGLFYTNHNKEGLVGFADAGNLSDPHNARSQTGYVFTHGGTAISWHSMKQTIAATSSNHSEILDVHEASRELFRTGRVIRVVLFFLYHGFVPLDFPDKVLMREHLKRITISVWL